MLPVDFPSVLLVLDFIFDSFVVFFDCSISLSLFFSFFRAFVFAAFAVNEGDALALSAEALRVRGSAAG